MKATGTVLCISAGCYTRGVKWAWLYVCLAIAYNPGTWLMKEQAAALRNIKL